MIFANYLIYGWHQIAYYLKKKSCIRETLNLSTDANISTNSIFFLFNFFLRKSKLIFLEACIFFTVIFFFFFGQKISILMGSR